MDPYTPLRARSGGRKKNLGLSAKEYTKVPHSHYHYDPSRGSTIQITGTIASVRRNRQQLSDDIYEDEDVRVRSSRENSAKSVFLSMTCVLPSSHGAQAASHRLLRRLRLCAHH